VGGVRPWRACEALESFVFNAFISKSNRQLHQGSSKGRDSRCEALEGRRALFEMRCVGERCYMIDVCFYANSALEGVYPTFYTPPPKTACANEEVRQTSDEHNKCTIAKTSVITT